MQTIQLPTLVGLSRLKSLATILALLASPLAAQAAPVTFDLAATLSGKDGDPPAGQLTGSIDYDAKTGVFSAARMQVVLNESGDLFELTIIDPEFNAFGKVVALGDVKGESSDKDHKGEVSLLFTAPPNPTAPVEFSGFFVDWLPDEDPVTYSLRGTSRLAVPEPATYALLGVGLAAAALTRRREQRT